MQVILHGAGRNAEPVGDLLVAESPGNELGDLPLASRKACEPPIRWLSASGVGNPKDDERIAEIARGLEVDRHIRAQGYPRGQVDQLAYRQRSSGWSTELSCHAAQAMECLTIEVRQVCRHTFSSRV